MVPKGRFHSGREVSTKCKPAHGGITRFSGQFNDPCVKKNEEENSSHVILAFLSVHCLLFYNFAMVFLRSFFPEFFVNFFRGQ